MSDIRYIVCIIEKDGAAKNDRAYVIVLNEDRFYKMSTKLFNLTKLKPALIAKNAGVLYPEYSIAQAKKEFGELPLFE